MNLLLLVGVATINASPAGLLVAGVTAFVAGGLSMVAGDHVSVPLLADTNTAGLSRERVALKVNRLADDEQIFSKGVMR